MAVENIVGTALSWIGGGVITLVAVLGVLYWAGNLELTVKDHHTNKERKYKRTKKQGNKQ